LKLNVPQIIANNFNTHWFVLGLSKILKKHGQCIVIEALLDQSKYRFADILA